MLWASGQAKIPPASFSCQMYLNSSYVYLNDCVCVCVCVVWMVWVVCGVVCVWCGVYVVWRWRRRERSARKGRSCVFVCVCVCARSFKVCVCVHVWKSVCLFV